MRNTNNKLDNFLNEFGFDDNLINDIFEYENVSGLYICEPPDCFSASQYAWQS